MSIGDRLKNVLGVAHPAGARAMLDEAELVTTHEKAKAALDEASRTAQGAGAAAAQQRAALDAAADHARMLLARSREARVPAQQIRDALDRAKLVALNAGLEGSRLGEGGGKALLSFADELRGVLSRGLEALDEHLTVLTQMDRERERLRDQLDHARERGGALADELIHSQNLQRVARERLEELGVTLKRATGADPQMAREIAEAAAHARGLLEAMSALSARPHRGWVMRALRPTLKPLLKLLKDIEYGPSRESRDQVDGP